MSTGWTATSQATGPPGGRLSIRMPAMGPRVNIRHGETPDPGWIQSSERQRIGVLFQGACVLAHLKRIDLDLDDAGWSNAHVDSEGRLCGVRAAARSSAQRPQHQLTDLAKRLFAENPSLAGRGQARRVARELVEEWRQDLVDLDLDDAIESLLRRASFLRSRGFGIHRGALVADVQRGGQTSVQFVGRPQSGHLHSCAHAAAARRVLEGDDFERLWAASGSAPGREATGVDGAVKPASEARLARSLRLFKEGRLESAVRELQSDGTLDERILRLRCLVPLGRWRAALRAVNTLQRASLTGQQLVLVGDAALRIFANLGQKKGVAQWTSKLDSLAEAGLGSQIVRRARVVAAFGYWDLGLVDEMARCLDGPWSPESNVEHQASYLHARALLELTRGRPEAAQRAVQEALKLARRHLARHEAGRLWNDLVLASVAADDLGGAERACRHAHRLLASCEGPGSETLTLSNLAEIRIRRGRFDGVEELLERVSERNRSDGNVRGWVEDQQLWARLEIGLGDLAAALDRLHGVVGVLDSKGIDWHRDQLRVLLARTQGLLGRRAQTRELLEQLAQLPDGLMEPEERVLVFLHAGLDERAELEARRSRLGARAAELAKLARVDWSQLDDLRIEDYRLARLAHDLHVLDSRSLTTPTVRRAASVLSSSGASRLANRLQSSVRDPWHVVDEFLGGSPTAGRLRSLFTDIGLEDLRLLRSSRAGDEVVVPGVGGRQGFEIETPDGTWTARADHIDALTRCLVRLVADRCGRSSRSGAPGSVVPQSVPGLPEGVVGQSPALVGFYEDLLRLSARELPILILGETGTGKEKAARSVHDRSSRRDGPYVAVNCAALTESLLMSELFGHVRGAFTGADRDRAGVFESARGGTVFLDEIGDLAPAAQGMLLRVLQEGEVRRVGESRARRVDVRVVAATHRDLESCVSAGRFREDLFYRLAVAICELPPLRQRGDDIVLLAEYFLKSEAGSGTVGADVAFTESALALLARHRWPGNVRQLRAVVARAAAVAESVIDVGDLKLPDSAPVLGVWHDWLDRLKRERLASELAACQGNRAAAARRLGLTRQALSYLVKQYGL